MKRHVVILCWLLVLVPTILVGTVALRLIRFEQERIRIATMNSYRAELQAISDNMMLAIDDVKAKMLDGLSKLDPGLLPSTLIEWEKFNPLIRNVFVLKNGGTMIHPDPERATSREEKTFLMRYDALFQGRQEWSKPPVDQGAAPSSPANDSILSRSTRVRQEMKGLGDISLAQSKRADADTAGEVAATAGGWIPWFADNQLHLLIWTERSGYRYGLELETMALLSRLIGYMPGDTSTGISYGLVDGEGKVIHQVGSLDLSEAGKKVVGIPAGEYLPHWELAIFNGSGALGGDSTLRYLMYGLLLLGLLIASTAGGSMLMIQAHRSRRDAVRKTSFVSNVSHELKTPLTSIRMYAELLEDDRVKDEEKKKKYLGTIVSETHRLTRLVNNVLDFSRLEQDRMPYDKTTFDAVAAVREITDTYSVHLGHVEIRLDLPSCPVEITYDSDVLEQILVNLLENARKYAPGSGPVDVALKDVPGFVHISIMDRGAGIARKHQKKIFDNFYRIDDSLTARSPGSGLGLSISRRLARLFGGDVVYAPRTGGGSEFILHIVKGITS